MALSRYIFRGESVRLDLRQRVRVGQMSYSGAEFHIGESISLRRPPIFDTSAGQHQDSTLKCRKLRLGGAAT